jgi:hypothetical protein
LTEKNKPNISVAEEDKRVEGFDNSVLLKKSAKGPAYRQKLSTTFSVDKSSVVGLRDMEDYEDTDSLDDELPASVTSSKEPMSNLARDLRSYIKMRGPITLHDYMAQALNHSAFGYYQYNSEKIGSQGDFITSPEISQLFGECVAVWCMSVWTSLGCPEEIKIIELGPGKGTLTKVK